MVWFLAIAGWLACTSDAGSEDGPGGEPPATAETGVTSPSGDTGQPVDDRPLDGWQVMPSREAGLHTPFLARHPSNGALFLTWGERGSDGFTRIWLASSTDGGRSFSTPQQVSEPLQDATAGWPEGPVLSVSEDRLTLAYGAFELGGTPYTIYVLQADVSATPTSAPLALERAVRVTLPRDYHSINYPTLAIGPDGQAWLSLVASPVYTGEIWVLRESEDWRIENVTATSPLTEPPCECCPPAFGMDPSGRVLLGWRGDIEKDLFVASSDGAGPFGDHVRITETGVSDLGCPQDGMEFLHVDGAMHLAWSDARPALSQGFLSREQSDGTWSHAPILTTGNTVQARVGAIPTAEGVLTHWDTSWGGDAWQSLAGSGSGRPVTVPVGALSQLRAIATPEGPLGVGVDDDGALWLVRLDTLAPSAR